LTPSRAADRINPSHHARDRDRTDATAIANREIRHAVGAGFTRIQVHAAGSTLRRRRSELVATMGTYWQDFSDAVAAAGVTTNGALTLSKHRSVIFYDTAGRHLNNRDVLFRDYAFRARQRADGSANVTLNYRHPDRLVATDRDMRSAKKHLRKTETKLEKDIKPMEGRIQLLQLWSHQGRFLGAHRRRHHGVVPRPQA
jgi:membrane-bound lytic murein transglycosylase